MPGISVSKICVPFGGGGIDWSSYWATRFPSALAAVVASDTQINLSWTNNGTEDYDSVSIERSADGVTYAEIDNCCLSATTYSDIGISADTLYYYRIRYCKDLTQYSAYSDVVSATTWVTEYNTVYASYTNKPNATDATRQNTLLKGLVDGGTYAKAVLLDMFAVHANTASEALKNWKSPGTFDPTLVNGPAFTAYEGFTGSFTSAKYGRTNFIPSSDGGGAIGQDNICAIWGIGTDVDFNTASFGAGNAGGYFRWKERLSDVCIVASPNGNNTANVTNTNSIKHYAMSRGAANNCDTYINKSKTNRAWASTTYMDKELAFCGYNNNGSFVGSDAQVRYVFLFSYLTEAEVTGVMDLVEAYLDSYGKGLM